MTELNLRDLFNPAVSMSVVDRPGPLTAGVHLHSLSGCCTALPAALQQPAAHQEHPTLQKMSGPNDGRAAPVDELAECRRSPAHDGPEHRSASVCGSGSTAGRVIALRLR